MSTLTTNSATSGASAAAAQAASASSVSASESQDRFLKLLVAQLNNQDPMNPMDNAQMTTQMAQISTVSGIEKLNQTVGSLGQQFSALQMLQGSTLVGREVLVAGNRLAVTDGVGRGTFDLPSGTSSTRVEVLSAGGQVVGSVVLGSQAAGRHDFSWDASAYNGVGSLQYRVVASDATGGALQATTYTRASVDSVSIDAGALALRLSSGASAGMEQVAEVY